MYTHASIANKWCNYYSADKVVWQAARCSIAHLTNGIAAATGVLETCDMAASNASLSVAQSSRQPAASAPTDGPAIDLQLTAPPVSCCYGFFVGKHSIASHVSLHKQLSAARGVTNTNAAALGHHLCQGRFLCLSWHP